MNSFYVTLSPQAMEKLRQGSTRVNYTPAIVAAMILESVLSTNEWSFIDAGETSSEDVSDKEGSK